MTKCRIYWAISPLPETISWAHKTADHTHSEQIFFQDSPIFFGQVSIANPENVVVPFLEIPQLCGFSPTSLLFREPVKYYLAEFFREGFLGRMIFR